MLSETTEQAQQELEAATITVGTRRYHEQQEMKGIRDGFDQRDDAAKTIRGAIPDVAKALHSWRETTKVAKGRPPVSLQPLLLLDMDQVAYIGLSMVFRALPDGGRVSKIVTSHRQGHSD